MASVSLSQKHHSVAGFIQTILDDKDIVQVIVVARAFNNVEIGKEGRLFSFPNIAASKSPLLIPDVANKIDEFFQHQIIPNLPDSKGVIFHIATLHESGEKLCRRYQVTTLRYIVV